MANVCKIVETSVEYETLEAAVAALTAGQTIQMIAAAEPAADISVDKTFTLDLNGQTVTADIFGSKGRLTVTGSGVTGTLKDSVGTGKYVTKAGSAASKALIYSRNGAKVIIESGEWSSAGVPNAAVVLVAENSTLDINGGKLPGESFSVTTNGSLSTGTVITVSDGELSSNDDYAIYAADKTGTVNITGGTITGQYGGIATNGSTLNISGGTVIAKGIPNPIDDDGGATDGTIGEDAAAIAIWGEYAPVTAAIEDGTFEAQGVANVIGLATYNASTIEVTGGEFKATGENSEIIAVREVEGKEAVPTATVSGGSFNKAFDEKYLAPDTELVENEDGTFGPAPVDPDPEGPDEPGGDDDKPEEVDLSKKASSYDILVYNSITMPPYNYKDKDWRRDV